MSSFYSNYPAPRRYRGRLEPEYFWKVMEVRLKRTILISMVLGSLLIMFSTSIIGRRLIYAVRTGNMSVVTIRDLIK